MMWLRRARYVAAGLLLMVLAATAAPALGAPQQQTNLLQNAGFENGTYEQVSDGNTRVPNNWIAWWQTPESDCYNYKPSFDVDSTGTHVHTGTYAAHYYTAYTSHTAGLYQQVPATAGATYQFTIYGFARSLKSESDASSGSTTQMMIGIDPAGGTNPFASTIVWSGAANALDSYKLFTVQAAASATSITVFVRNRPDWCVARNDVYWDDANLTQTGAAGAQATAVPTAVPAAQSGISTRAAPDANGRIVHTVQRGDSLSYIAWLYGVSIDQIKQLNGLTNNVAVLGVKLVIKEGDTAPTEAPTAEASAESTPAEGTGGEATPPPADTQVAEANGTVCVLGYLDRNSNGIRDADESPLAGVTFALNNGTQMVGQYTTDGVNEPHCFADLTPGNYVVSWTGDGMTATTDQTWVADLAPGSILTREFGVQTAAAAASGQQGQQAGRQVRRPAHLGHRADRRAGGRLLPERRRRGGILPAHPAQ